MKKLRQLFKRNNESDTRVSRRVIIVLIIAISVMSYIFVQVSVVPFWNKELETEHVDVVYSDMTSLKSNLTDVAQHDIPRSSMIHLGVLYPNRFLFFNPGPGAAGNLTVEKVGITGSYSASGASTHQISYDSSRIVYVLDGIIPSPKLVYEHGIIIWDWGDNRTVTANNQSLIKDDTGTVFIPVVNANPCVTSGVETEIFEIYPYSSTSDRTGVEHVTITLDTDYPELWQDLLRDYIKAGLVSVSNQTKKIRISSSALPYISLPDQPATGAVSSGIITFSKELPPGALLTFPAAITQNATLEKNVTSTPKVTPTPTPTARARVASGGGGGGGGGSIANEPPIVTTKNATNVSAVSARLNMAFEFHDYTPVQVQFRYKAEGGSVWNETGWVPRNGSGAHTYAEPIDNLSTNTTYNFTALLLYDGAELNGTEVNFTTGIELIPPVVVTENATDVSVVTTTLNMVFEFNDYSPVQVQFRYKAEGASVWNETGWVTQNGSGAHTYAEPITNLSANTTYNFTAMLRYVGTELNGTWLNFTTSREPIPPVVVTEKATDVSVATATLNMAFEFHDYTPVQVQFRYKAEGASAWNETVWVSRNGSGAHTFAEPIANLTANTTYYLFALLFYDGIALNGTEVNFTTSREPIPPTIWTGNATNVSVATTTLNRGYELSAKNTYYSMAKPEKTTCVPAANVTLDMGFDFHDYSSVLVQFRYKAEGATGWTDTGWVQQNGSGTHTYTKQITNLSANTTYYYMAMLLYEGMAVNGSAQSFTTCRELITPTVETGKATNVSMAAATLNMAFEFHDYTPVNVQFMYKAEGASAWNETGWVTRKGSGADKYAEPIANLSYVTTYYFRAQLLYDGIVIEGAEKSLTTLERPAVRTKTATNITDAAAALNMAFDFKDYRTVHVQFKYKAEGASVWNETKWVSQTGFGFRWYTGPIANLSSDTTYQFKARLRYDRTVLEGVERSFTSLEQPTVITKTASDIMDVSARLNMAFDLKDYNTVQVQFRYKAENASGWDDTGWVAQNGSHMYSEPIANLSTNTTYYFSALLLYDGTVIEGVEKSFRTFEPPTVTTENATNISDVAATLNMSFDFNDYSLVNLQFRYKAEGASAWNETVWVSRNGSGAHTFAEPIANLTANTTYYLFALLFYDGIALNGTEVNFTTSREPIPPTIWTGNATNVSVATTTLNRGYELSAKNTYYSMAKPEKTTCVPAANVTLDMGFDFHDYSSVLVQFRYKAEGATGWTDTGWVQQNGSGTHTYAKQITNLSPNTTYYYMAMLLYGDMAVNGSAQSFTTCRESITPTVETRNATNVSMAAATLNMAFDFKDYRTVHVQFRYKAEGVSAWNETGWVAQNGSGSHTYAEPIANLSYVTTYYFRAQLHYDGIVINGTEKSFTTLERPEVRTKTATNISDAAATLNMAFEFKDYRTVQVQFRYKAEGASVWNETKWVSQTGFGFRWYTSPIANLSSDTTYQFKARLRYDRTVLEGVERSFTSLEQPTVITKTASDIMDVSARLNMAFDLKDYNTVQVQFRYKAENASLWNDTGWVAQNGSHMYSEPIANLSTNTTYYFSALLLYDGTVIEGVEKSFRTFEPPTVRTENATNISDVAATLNMTFYLMDYRTVQVQFRYKAEGASVWNDTGLVYQNISHTYSETIANLSTNTTYYFSALLLYDGTVIEGVEKSFTTLDPPTVTTENATNVSDGAATLNMTFELKDYSQVQVQFKYKAEGASVWNDTGWVYQNSSQTYSEPITNLSAIKTYYYKAQLLYGSTEIEGKEKSFMTLDQPTVHTKTATNITDAAATLNMAFDFNDYSSVLVQFSYKAKDESEWNDTGWVTQNGSGFYWYSEPIAGLSSSTVYQFKALLRYDGTVIDGLERSFISAERPTVSTKKAIVQELPRGWTATLKMDYDFKDYDQGYVRFAYKKVGEDADWYHTGWIGASHSGSRDELIMGLENRATYYFYAQLKYGDENNIEGDTLTFKTLGPR